MADNTISIKEDAAPTKFLASQSFTRTAQTVHQEEVAIGDGTNNGRIVAVSAAGALKVDSSAAVQPISDNGGAITVDAIDLDIRNLATGQDKVDVRIRDAADAAFIEPVIKTQLPAALVGGRLDVNIGASAATVTADVSDRDARLLGRTKILDSAGAVIDPALKGQLPAALVGGRLDDNIGSWMGATTPTVGQKAMAASLPVVVASDQSVISVTGDVDHDAVNTLKNIQVAGHASPADVPPTLVSATGDRARIWTDRAGAVVVRRRKLRESYTAVARLAETAARMDFTFTHVANTNKQLVTFHHAATAVKEIRIQKVVLYATLLGTTAGFWNLELRAITGTPATGNPAITPKAHRLDAAATEAVCLVLPTTAGTDATANSPYGSFIVDHGIEATTPPVAHPLVSGLTAGFPFTLYDASAEDDEMHPIILRVGTLEGVAINSRDTSAMVLRAWAIIKYTEEIP
jgi:hypothetical protein